MKITLIPTGRVRVDPGGPFGLVPRSLWSAHQPSDKNNLVPMDLNSCLIETEGTRILIDTGLGDKLSPKGIQYWNLDHPSGTLVDNLEKSGITPDNIDIVINTHLHWDHCGGNTRIKNEETVPAFPNAQYWVQRIEWADAMHPDARTRGTYLAENFGPLWKRGQLKLLNGDTQVTTGIHCVVTRGHTRAHQSILIDIEPTPILCVADMASFAIHMARSAWVTAYDIEPLENIATKHRWQKWAVEKRALLFFEHDTVMPLAQLEEGSDGKLTLIPVDLAEDRSISTTVF